MPYKNIEDKRKNDKEYARKHHVASSPQSIEVIQRSQAAVTPKVKVPAHGLRIMVLTDVQAKPGVPLDHLTWAGKYAADKQPDVIVCIGDFADMESLSSYDRGTGRAEGRRIKADFAATAIAMEKFMTPIAKVRGWKPDLHFTLGNHEERITRATTDDPMWEGILNIEDLKYQDYGWRVYPFMQPVVIGGVSFCHFFPSGVMGKPITTARALLTKLHMSAFAGHQQGRDIAHSRRADGTDLTAIISGSFYQHQEKYLTPFTNNHWRGFYMLNEVKDGSYDYMGLSLNYMQRRYGSTK